MGDTVRRPRSDYRTSINRLLQHVSASGLVEVPIPLGVDDHGRETFSFIKGDVAIPPYPLWAVTERSLRSVADLLRRYHEAISSFSTKISEWPSDLADPAGGDLLCHNDVCLENVVFRNGVAVGLLDFDFAAPGRRLYDVAMTLRMCGPVRHPSNIPESFGRVDPIDRLSAFCETYGVHADEGHDLVEGLLSACRAGRAFVRNRAAAGHPWFSELWKTDGPARYERDEAWIIGNAGSIIGTLGGSAQSHRPN